jgi:hypothetical protein
MDDQPTRQVEGQTEPSEPKRLGIFGWCLWASIFLLVYFLSSGPAARLADTGLLPKRILTVVYLPLYTLCRLSEPTERLYFWYITLWYPRPVVDIDLAR